MKSQQVELNLVKNMESLKERIFNLEQSYFSQEPNYNTKYKEQSFKYQQKLEKKRIQPDISYDEGEYEDACHDNSTPKNQQNNSMNIMKSIQLAKQISNKKSETSRYQLIDNQQLENDDQGLSLSQSKSQSIYKHGFTKESQLQQQLTSSQNLEQENQISSHQQSFQLMDSYQLVSFGKKKKESQQLISSVCDSIIPNKNGGSQILQKPHKNNLMDSNPFIDGMNSDLQGIQIKKLQFDNLSQNISQKNQDLNNKNRANSALQQQSKYQILQDSNIFMSESDQGIIPIKINKPTFNQNKQDQNPIVILPSTQSGENMYKQQTLENNDNNSFYDDDNEESKKQQKITQLDINSCKKNQSDKSLIYANNRISQQTSSDKQPIQYRISQATQINSNNCDLSYPNLYDMSSFQTNNLSSARNRENSLLSQGEQKYRRSSQQPNTSTSGLVNYGSKADTSQKIKLTSNGKMSRTNQTYNTAFQSIEEEGECLSERINNSSKGDKEDMRQSKPRSASQTLQSSQKIGDDDFSQNDNKFVLGNVLGDLQEEDNKDEIEKPLKQSMQEDLKKQILLQFNELKQQGQSLSNSSSDKKQSSSKRNSHNNNRKKSSQVQSPKKQKNKQQQKKEKENSGLIELFSDNSGYYVINDDKSRMKISESQYKQILQIQNPQLAEQQFEDDTSVENYINNNSMLDVSNNIIQGTVVVDSTDNLKEQKYNK